MFKIAICDDEITICSQIENILINYFKTTTIKADIEVFYDGESLYSFIEENGRFDLIFLDIELDGMNGVEFGKKVRYTMSDMDTEIIYVSGTTQYDRQLFSVQPLQFIEKPISPETVINYLELAIKKLQISEKMFTFQSKNKTIRLKYSDIIYFESQQRTIVVSSADTEYRYYGKISDLKEELPDFFFDIHRSYILNTNKISKYMSDHVIMSNDQSIPIGKSRKADFLAFQMQKENLMS